MTSLSDKLKSLGVKVGARDLPPPRPRRAFSAEQVLAGRAQETPYGEAFVIETVYPSEYRHGRAGLQIESSLETIAQWAREARVADCEKGTFVFLDTETTGLAGGTGTYAFLIGVGRYEGESFRLAQFFMRDPLEEGAVLAGLEQFLDPCAVIVTFNGKAFDIPLLNARYITQGRPTPFSTPAHLDLLPLARRLWRARLESRALGYLETHILGAERTEQDVGGWLIPSLYFDYLRSGDARPLRGVLYHNAMDVLAMAALLNHVARMLTSPLDGFVEHGLDLVSMGRLFEELGQVELAVQLYERGLEYELPEESREMTMRRLALAQRRRGDTWAALELWRRAAGSRHVYAHVELAKYYEHEARDYSEAAQWTRAALGVVSSPDTPQHIRREWLAELEHRLRRLEGRQKRVRERRQR